MFRAIALTIMNVREFPDISGIRSPHVVSGSVVFLRDANAVEIERKPIALSEKQNVIVSRRKPARSTDALRVVPANPAVEPQAEFLFEQQVDPNVA
jgi:hypothetical protein